MIQNKLLQGDCVEVMQTFEADSVDLLVTDPPYGYSFMGKDWDRAVPSVGVWRECLRVLKAGAFAFVMSSPRADVLSHMIVNLSDAGFRTDFTPIYWCYASGFPKAMNVGKMVDKRLGGNGIITNQKTCPDIRANNYSNSQGKKRLYVGDYEPEKAEARLLDGSYGGFQPKPAVEVILVAMKPLSEKTFVDQALKNGKGVSWLDDARIPYESEDDKASARPGGVITTALGSFVCRAEGKVVERANETFNPTGRFPANLLVSDDCLNDGTIHSSGSINDMGKGFGNSDIFGDGENIPRIAVGDSGSFSRFFSLDAWFEKQFRKLPFEVQRTFPFLIEPKASKSERNKGCEYRTPQAKCGIDKMGGEKCTMKTGSGNERNVKYLNNHPTVKPLQLMSYLITLGSRLGDLVLDPFCGSGTTCLAAKMLGRNYVGVELVEDYFEIARARVDGHKTIVEFMRNVS